DALIQLARSEMARLAGVSATPALARVFRWPQSMPQYVVGHRVRLDRIARLLARHPGLSLAGASYRGVGIPDCIASGSAAAGDALEQIGAAAGRSLPPPTPTPPPRRLFAERHRHFPGAAHFPLRPFPPS